MESLFAYLLVYFSGRRRKGIPPWRLIKSDAGLDLAGKGIIKKGEIASQVSFT